MDTVYRDINYVLITNLTQDLIRDYRIRIPVHPEELVRSLGGTLTRKECIPPYKPEELWKRGDSFEIILPCCREEDAVYRTCRGIGSLYLYMGYQIGSTVWNRYTDNTMYNARSEEEVRHADTFALSLAMPEDDYRFYLHDHKGSGDTINIRMVADYFHVSPLMAELRGARLGVLRGGLYR